MWNAYTSDSIKNNRSSNDSIRIAAFLSALLLSLLCGLFYNLWKYEVERIELEEGGWHSRITGRLNAKQIETITNFAAVENVTVHKTNSRNQEHQTQGQELVVDLYFQNMQDVFSDTSKLMELVEISPETVTYHYELLAMYLIRSEQDTAPRLILPLFLLIMGLASISLIVIIHNAFAVSMNARIHQFGILSSIGATPRQIRKCFLQEAVVLCAIPVLVGDLLGIVCSMGILQMSNMFLGEHVPGRHEAVFGYHPLVLVWTLLITGITVWISARLPARKLSRMTPLEAVKSTGELELKRKKESRILKQFFGVEGELAGNALRAQKKALRTATLSLLCSILAFTIMQCFFTLSEISTRETYFERYQDVWDIMVTVRDTEIDSFEKTQEIQELSDVESAIVYQKAAAKRIITEGEMSEEMKAFGGFSHASGEYVTRTGDGWLVNAPIVILDDASFLKYCEQTGASPRLDGGILYNQIRDVTNPDFRHPQYMPYVKTEQKTSKLRPYGNEETAVEIPVLSYTEATPDLREEYATLDYYELVHVVPLSLWKEIKGQIANTEEDTFVCILGKENAAAEDLASLQNEINATIMEDYIVESENRIQEYEINDKEIQGMMEVLGIFCALLAIIGIGNVFSNTLGFVRQRRREFARYMSIGMTPKEIRNLFCIEACTLAGRPMLVTTPLAVLTVGSMLKASYIVPAEFLSEAPWIPISGFILAIWGAVALAYGLAWCNMRRISLSEVLRDDTMM